MNAGELWDELRNDSRMKLLKEDSTIAPELKVNRHSHNIKSLKIKFKLIKIKKLHACPQQANYTYVNMGKHI